MQRGLLWPLRDGQEAPALWFCPHCGEEQYREDRSALRQGMVLCLRCLSQLEQEEELQTP